MAPMKHSRQPLAKDRIEALVASAVDWLVRLLGVLLSQRATRRRRLLHRLVQRAERGVEGILYLDAHRHFFEALGCTGPRPRATARPHSIAPGFRRTRGRMRLFFKSARIRLRKASLIARVTHLIEALIYRALYVMHFMVRMARGLCFSHIVPCAPPAVALRADAPRALCFADSS